MFGRLIKTILVVAGITVLPVLAFGQIPGASFVNELGVQVIPNYPRPNEKVSIILSLYTDDLNSANISWYENGKLVLEGIGEIRHSFKMGEAGKDTTIEIKIKLQSGSSFSKSFTLSPASVDLVWEANSYVPPFYKGKALHSKQGSLKVVATPEFIVNGRQVSAKELIYEWSNDTEAYQNQSGYGKNVLIINGSLFGQTDSVEVLVTDPKSNLAASRSLSVTPTDPQIIFYENDPYYGHQFDTAIQQSFDLKTEEVQVWAAPYYFTKEKTSNLKYGWQLNGLTVPNLSESRTAIFRKPEDASGSSGITLSIENLNRVLQQASAGMTINFKD